MVSVSWKSLEATPKRGLELAVGETAKDLSEEVFSLRHLAFLGPIFQLLY